MIDKNMEDGYNKDIEAVRYPVKPEETRFDFSGKVIEAVRYMRYTRHTRYMR